MTNSNVWIVILSVFLLIVYLTFSQADALTREELNVIEDKLDDIKIKISNIEIDIEDEKEEIIQLEKDLSVAKDELREAKRNSSTSWTALENIMIAEKKITSIETEIKGKESQLDSMLDTKSQFIRKENKYNVQLKYQDSADKITLPSTQNKTIVNTTSPIILNVTSPIILNVTDSQIPESMIMSLNDTKIVNLGTSTGLKNKIGIELSGTCIVMIKNNLTNNPCPTYKDLILYDSSNTDVSGQFTTENNGFFHRDSSTLQESWRWYDYDTLARLFVDPPLGMNDRIKMITIVPNFHTYLVQGDLTQKNIEVISKTTTDRNGTTFTTDTAVSLFQPSPFQETARILYHDRYVEDCKNATINANKWQELLDDTIIYLQNDCNESMTNVVVKEVIPIEKTEIDIRTSPAYQYKKWLADVLSSCIITRTCE